MSQPSSTDTSGEPPSQQPSYEDLPGEEFARRGNRLFEDQVRPHVDVEAEARKFVAIDVETGDYEVSSEQRQATQQLLERRPEAKGRIWFRRVGSESAYHVGSRFLPSKPAPQWALEPSARTAKCYLNSPYVGPPPTSATWKRCWTRGSTDFWRFLLHGSRRCTSKPSARRRWCWRVKKSAACRSTRPSSLPTRLTSPSKSSKRRNH